jgi:hypothetical protein
MAVDLDFERKLHRERELAPEGSLFDTFANQVLRRADEVIAGQACPFPPSDKHRRFLMLLRNHQGASRSVALGHIAERMALTPRDIKGIVRDLRLHFGVQIGSGRSDETGYWLIDSVQDCLDSTGPMYRQAISELRLVLRMRRGAEQMDRFLSQLTLDLCAQEETR